MAKFGGNRRDRLEELAEQKPDYQCAYTTAGGIRCLELGTLSDSTTGGGPWYCIDHSRERGTAFADQVAELTYKYQPKPKPSWRDELIEQRMKELNLPAKMTFEDFRRRIGDTLLGKFIVEQIINPVDYFEYMAETVDL